MGIVYVVTYLNKDKEPVVMVFDNYSAASDCFREFNTRYSCCCLDSCDVYKSFYPEKES